MLFRIERNVVTGLEGQKHIILQIRYKRLTDARRQSIHGVDEVAEIHQVVRSIDAGRRGETAAGRRKRIAVRLREGYGRSHVDAARLTALIDVTIETHI